MVIDPYPTLRGGRCSDRTDNIYLLPACTSIRDLRLGNGLEPLDPVARARSSSPIFGSRSRTTGCIIYAKFAEEARLRRELFKNIKVEERCAVSVEDITAASSTSGMWTIGYTGQSPERLKRTCRQPGTPSTTDHHFAPKAVRWTATITACPGRAGEPPEMGHPGTPILYDPSKARGRGRPHLPCALRCRSAMARPCSPRAPTAVGSEISRTAIPSSPSAMLKEARLGRTTSPTKLASDPKLSPATSPNRGRPTFPAASSGSPSSTADRPSATPRRGANRLEQFPDPVPVHREPLYTPAGISWTSTRPTRTDERQYRLPNIVMVRSRSEDYSRRLPDHPDLRPSRGIRGRRRGAAAPIRGSPSCSRTCSASSIPMMPTPPASGTAR